MRDVINLPTAHVPRQRRPHPRLLSAWTLPRQHCLHVGCPQLAPRVHCLGTGMRTGTCRVGFNMRRACNGARGVQGRGRSLDMPVCAIPRLRGGCQWAASHGAMNRSHQHSAGRPCTAARWVLQDFLLLCVHPVGSGTSHDLVCGHHRQALCVLRCGILPKGCFVEY